MATRRGGLFQNLSCDSLSRIDVLKKEVTYHEIMVLSGSLIVGNKPKVRISKRVFQEKKARQIFRKTKISYPLIRTRTCAYQRLRNCGFSENLACFVFLKHPFWDSTLFVITDVMLWWNRFKKVELWCNIRRQQRTNCLSVFDHFVGLALKRLRSLIAHWHYSLGCYSLAKISPHI